MEHLNKTQENIYKNYNTIAYGSLEEVEGLVKEMFDEKGISLSSPAEYTLMAYLMTYYGRLCEERQKTEEKSDTNNKLYGSKMEWIANTSTAAIQALINYLHDNHEQIYNGYSEAYSPVSDGMSLLDPLDDISKGHLKDIVTNQFADTIGGKASSFIPEIIASRLPPPIKVATIILAYFAGDIISYAAEKGIIDIPQSDLETFPEKLDPRFEEILKRSGLDQKGVMIDALNAYETYMKQKDGKTGPTKDKAESMSSPIILDLDNDGIETISLKDGVYFDHDNNSYIEKTGWVNSDDALLVRDLDHNGTIDSGAELFGNNTLNSNGKKASNGYAALKDLDSNNDGIINSEDKEWSSLSLWIDKNSNGYSEENEIFNLSDFNIKSLNLDYTSSNITDDNNNKHKQLSEAQLEDGSTIATADVWFNESNQNTYHIPTEKIKKEILILPNISGMGNVKSLREAMNENPQLLNMVKEYIRDPLSHLQDNLIENIVFTWCGVEGAYESNKLASFIINITGNQYNQHGSSIPLPSAQNELKRELIKFEKYVSAQLLKQSEFALEFGTIDFIYNEITGECTLDTSAFESLLDEIAENHLERSLYIRYIFANSLKYIPEAEDLIQKIGIPDLAIIDKNNNISQVNNYENISTTYYIKDGFNKISITDKSLNSSSSNHIIVEGHSSKDIEFIKKDNDLILHFSNEEEIILNDYFSSKNYRFISLQLADVTYSSDDILSKEYNIYGTDLSDTLSGSNNNDTLYGSTGNDRLDGGKGNDTYRFQVGHGKDTVYDSQDRSANTLVFKGATADNLQIEKVGNDLLIHAYGTEDTVTVSGYFIYSAARTFSIVLDDKTLSTEDIAAMGFEVNGSDKNDSLSGWSTNDVLHGNSGDDSLYGDSGNDTLDGGTGNDLLNGGSGNDTYRFRAGHGKDTITDNATSAINTLSFEDASSHNVDMERSGNNLIINAYGSNDSVTINSYFSSTNYRRLQLEFENETIDMDELADFVADTLAKSSKSTLQSQRTTTETPEADTSEETLWFAQSNNITLEDMTTQTKAAVQHSVVTESTTEAQLQQLIDAMASFGEADTSGSGQSVNTRLNENSYAYLVTPQ